MPNSNNSGNINVGQTLLDMNKLLGQITQLTADTSNDVKDIKSNQKTADTRLANVEFKLDEFQRDMTDIKSAHSALEARTTVLENKDTKRTSWAKGAVFVTSGMVSLIVGLLLNIGTLIEVFHIWQGIKGDKIDAEISAIEDQAQE